MFKILVLFALFTYTLAQDDKCRCGYKYISTGKELDIRIKEPRRTLESTAKYSYKNNRLRRSLQYGTENNTWLEYDYDEFPEDLDEFTNVTRPKNTAKLEDRIAIGGKDEAKETGVNEFPMIAAIYWGLAATGGYLYAAGTIISKRFVLSAAHVLVILELRETYVVVGEHDRKKNLSPDAVEIRARNFRTHSLYNASTHDYDIGLIEVELDIPFSDRVGPACLPFKFVDKDFTGLYGTYLGWGPDIPHGPPSDFLRKVDVQVISQDMCRKYHSEITPRHLCAYSVGKDACDQDSGGPFLYTDPDTKKLYVIGIISFGRFCVNINPGVNTRVTALLDWIVDEAPDAYCGQPKIPDWRVPGIKTPPGTYPALAAVVDATDYTIVAPATIFSKDSVITSATAIKKLVDKNHAALIIFGEKGFSEGVNADTPAIRGARYVIHEQFQERVGMYDIGIIQLEKKIDICQKSEPNNKTKQQKNNKKHKKAKAKGSKNANRGHRGRRWIPVTPGTPPASDWGSPLPPLKTTCKGCLPDQCFNVLTLSDHQICDHRENEANCDFHTDDGRIIFSTGGTHEFDMGLITYGRCGFCVPRKFGGEHRIMELTGWMGKNKPPDYA